MTLTDCEGYYNKETVRRWGVSRDRWLWKQVVISTRYIPRKIDLVLRWSVSPMTWWNFNLSAFILKFTFQCFYSVVSFWGGGIHCGESLVKQGTKEMESLLFLFLIWPRKHVWSTDLVTVSMIQIDMLKLLKAFVNEPVTSESEWEDIQYPFL